jgi:hypothetical protein
MFTKKLALGLLTSSLLLSLNSLADTSKTKHGENISSALKNSDVSLSFRGRYESVDQDGIRSSADALTVKSRLSISTGRFHSFSMGLEVDDVFSILDDYNDTKNALSQYPIVADPEATDINLAYLKYSTSNIRVVVGRQRIKHDNQRFVGNVGWRQNEQTYDGLRGQYKKSAFELDYSFISNINNVVGDNIKGAFHLANLRYSFNKNNGISLFGYMLDFDDAPTKSSSTFGVSYQGRFGGIIVNATGSTQGEHGDNTNTYSATYLNAELGYQFSYGGFTILGGYELLGSDEGISFQTPLATSHSFQGWADKFISTPGDGLQDIYLTVKGKMFSFDIQAAYHDYVADINDTDLGSEINALASYQINKNYSVLFKYASYSAGSSRYSLTDTDKIWVQFSANY